MMRKVIFSLVFLVVIAFSGTAYAAQSEEMDCCQLEKECMEMCKDMDSHMECCELKKNGKMQNCMAMMKNPNIDCCEMTKKRKTKNDKKMMKKAS